MKKFILFVCTSVFALIAGAQTTITLAPNSWEIDKDVFNYNLQGAQKVSAGEWKAGDVISIEFTGTSNAAVSGLSIILVDQSEAADWWKELCKSEALSDVEAGGDVVYSGEITLTADVVTPSAVNLVFSTPGSDVKVTEEVTLTFSAFEVKKPGEVESPTESISLNDLGAGWDATYDAATQTISYEKEWVGKGWWLGGADLSNFASITVNFEAVAFQGKLVVERTDGTSLSAEFAAGATSVKCALSGDLTDIAQIYIQNGAIGDLVLTEAFYTKKGFDEGGEEGGEGGDTPEVEPVFTLTMPSTMFEAQYDDKENPDKITGYVAKIDMDVEELMIKTGDIVAIAFDGSFNVPVTGISPAIIDACEATAYWGEISGWDWVQLDAAANAPINKTAKIKITKDAQSTTIVACIPVQGGNGEEEIKFTKTGDPTAVKAVASNAFAVNGGMVFSKGEITVYNIAGKVVATASKTLNVNSLNAGVYFITAPEGTIKFVK